MCCGEGGGERERAGVTRIHWRWGGGGGGGGGASNFVSVIY